jgi:hypothetical protein
VADLKRSAKPMHPKIKLHLVSALYCAVLISQNWFRSITTQLTNGGHLKEEVYPVEVAAGLSGAIAMSLAFFCLLKAKRRLEDGRRVRDGKWIQSYLCLLYPLPLLWHQSSSSTSIAGDGATTILSHGYGHALSVWVFCFSVVGLLLLQIAFRLSDLQNRPNQALQPTGLLARG